MTIRAYKDNADGYYQADVPVGQPDPSWVIAKGLTPTAVIPPVLPTAMKLWERAMAGTDAIPRWAEDIISGNPPAQSTLDAVATKKALRLTKP